jgi:hypothetical protein
MRLHACCKADTITAAQRRNAPREELRVSMRCGISAEAPIGSQRTHVHTHKQAHTNTHRLRQAGSASIGPAGGPACLLCAASARHAPSSSRSACSALLAARHATPGELDQHLARAARQLCRRHPARQTRRKPDQTQAAMALIRNTTG